MGFKANQIKVKGVPTSELGSPLTVNVELTEKEIQFLLLTIKNSLFKGEYVEICYNTTLKLQKKYKENND